MGQISFGITCNVKLNLLSDAILAATNISGSDYMTLLLVAWFQLKIQNKVIREAFGLKNVTKSGNSPHSSWSPPPPLGSFGLFEIGKNLKFNDPPPVPNLGKIWNWENFESSEPPLKYGT